jgi:hypothetical protein
MAQRCCRPSADKRNKEAEAQNITRLSAIDARIVVIDKELAANFPDYAALVRPAPLSVEDVRSQLAADDVLFCFSTRRRGSRRRRKASSGS